MSSFVWTHCSGREEVGQVLGRLVCGTPVRALAGRGFCKLCKKFYDDNKSLEAHEKRRHPRPPVPSDERDADGEREA